MLLPNLQISASHNQNDCKEDTFTVTLVNMHLSDFQETKDFKQFSVHMWYPLFSDVAIKTLIFEMDSELQKHLQEDGCDVNIENICSDKYINQLKDAIRELKSEAFVKNNWHAPVVRH